MVKTGLRAQELMVNTSFVQLEGLMAGINGDRDGTNGGAGNLEGCLVFGGNVFVVGDGGGSVGSGVVARSLGGEVRIAGFAVNTAVLDNVFESIIHQTSIATLVSFGGGAVHQILFRKTDEGVASEFPRSLSRTGGTETPA